MEKSEVSDTDAPAIRQAIHGSQPFAFSFSREEERASQAGRERYTPEVTFVYRRTIARMPRMSRSSAQVLRDPSRASSGQAEPKYSAHCTKNVGPHARVRANPRCDGTA